MRIINQADVGKWVRLKGKSDHGKTVIGYNGNIWKIAHVAVNKRVQLQSREVSSWQRADRIGYGRWVTQGEDENYVIVEFTDSEGYALRSEKA